MAVDAQDAGALATLTMLEERLHRLEFLLHGSSDAFGIPDLASTPSTQSDNVSTRITKLEGNLHRLASRHGLIQDVLNLRMNPSI